MTWAFLFLVPMLVGLVLAGVSGFLRDLRALATRHLVVTHASHRLPLIDVFGRALSPALILFGICGLALGTGRDVNHSRVALIASAVGAVGFLLGRLVVPRSLKPGGGPSTGTAIRDIPPGGYGQVRLGEAGANVVMAAQSIDPEPIPAGAVVQVVDSTHSVLTVRLLADRPT